MSDDDEMLSKKQGLKTNVLDDSGNKPTKGANSTKITVVGSSSRKLDKQGLGLKSFGWR